MFSKSILFAAATVLASINSVSAQEKWDCYGGLDCAGSANLADGGCLCDGTASAPAICTDLGMTLPVNQCNQAATYEGCFLKGGLSANIWGVSPPPTNGMDATCWMNKYDCWSDCECSANGAPVPLNTMGGNGMTGADNCWTAINGEPSSSATGGSSACVWGHCGPEFPITYTMNDVTRTVTIPHECEVNPDNVCGGTWGDPHIKMWDGETYDYHGACDLVFLDAPSMNMTIQVRTTIRYDYSYISSAVLSLNGETIELGAFGSLIVNGVSTVYDSEHGEVPETIGGYPLSVVTSNKKNHQFRLELDNGQWVQLKSYKDLVGVSLDLLHEGVMDSQGLMGSVKNGEKLGRDGVTVFTDLNEFGQEWQVGSSDAVLFEARADFPGEKCRLPSAKSAQSRRLGEGIARSEAEAACAHMKMNKAACISDVMSTGDMGIAGAF